MLPPSEPPWRSADVAGRAFGAVRVHAVRSGFVATKEALRTQRGPESLRLLGIVTDKRWTEWMPVYFYVIEHPHGVFVVDAGQTETTGAAARLDCDGPTRWFYENELRFAFRPEERIDRRLGALGIDPARVRGVVLTHRHADHADGIAALPARSRLYVSAADWKGHRGAVPAEWPKGSDPILVEAAGGAYDAFPWSRPLLPDGSVRIVPLEGHSPGHLGVLVTGGDGTRVLLAGDAAYSLAQVRTRTLAGIVEVPQAARGSIERIRAQMEQHPTLVAFTHEPASLERLESGTPAVLGGTSPPASRGDAAR